MPGMSDVEVNFARLVMHESRLWLYKIQNELKRLTYSLGFLVEYIATPSGSILRSSFQLSPGQMN